MNKNASARAGLIIGLGAFLACGGGAIAQEGVAIKNLLGSMGIIPPEKDPIRYRERAPLVLPPKGGSLREPTAPENFASSNPQWPNDPDVAARQRRSAEERTPVTWSETRRMADTNPRLSIDEIRAGRVARQEETGPQARHRGDNSRENLYLTPDQMRAMGRPKEDAATAGIEPQRRVLSDPPTGMRKPARNGQVAASYDPKVDQMEADASPLNWIRRRFSRDDDE